MREIYRWFMHMELLGHKILEWNAKLNFPNNDNAAAAI